MKFTEEQVQKVMRIIITPKTAIACRTQDEANSLLSMLNSQGIRWSNGEICLGNTKWQKYQTRTEYNLEDGSLKFGSIGWAEDNAYTIVYFEDIFASQVSLLDILLT